PTGPPRGTARRGWRPWAFAPGRRRISGASAPIRTLEGDLDLFGDGSVTIMDQPRPPAEPEPEARARVLRPRRPTGARADHGGRPPALRRGARARHEDDGKPVRVGQRHAVGPPVG